MENLDNIDTVKEHIDYYNKLPISFLEKAKKGVHCTQLFFMLATNVAGGFINFGNEILSPLIDLNSRTVSSAGMPFSENSWFEKIKENNDENEEYHFGNGDHSPHMSNATAAYQMEKERDMREKRKR